jgi:hypothetical protein
MKDYARRIDDSAQRGSLGGLEQLRDARGIPARIRRACAIRICVRGS